MLKKIEHVGINVSDLDRSIAWYTNVLGLALRGRVRLRETTEIAFLTIGSSEIELVCNTSAKPEPVDGTVNHLTFTVDDIAGELARLRAHGVTLLNEEPVHLAPVGARIAFFRGPDGEKLELLERL